MATSSEGVVNSRSLDDLTPEAREKCLAWLDACQQRGVYMLVYCTYRSAEAQAIEYAKGRTVPWKGPNGELGYGPGHYTTMAKPWWSWHQYRCAWDAVPIVGSTPDWTYVDRNNDKTPDEPWWQVAVEEAAKLGIEWAGNWTTFTEYVHWQWTNGRTLAELRQDNGIIGDSNA